jgi:uncharacterized protein (DUF433 family)
VIANEPTMTIPLRTDEHGAIRIGKTRVLLELVIHAYYMGETPEGIVDSYPTLTTADVYAVNAYYLANGKKSTHTCASTTSGRNRSYGTLKRI